MTIQQKDIIPVEKGWPLLGVIPNFLKGDPFEYLKSVMLKHGDFVELKMLGKSVYLVSHPDLLKRILWENYHNYRKPDMLYKAAKEIAENGLVTSEGDVWLRQRRMIQPHLHRKHIANLFSDMVDAISDTLNGWESLAKSETVVELSGKMGEISSNVITRTMFGKDIIPDEKATEINDQVKRLVYYVGTTFYSTMVPEWFPIPGRKQYRLDLKGAHETINYIIAKCRNEKETSASLINMLINAVDEESQEQMTEHQLFDEVMTIFLAGYETTATALSWLGVILENYPEVLRKLLLEIDQVLGRRRPSFEDMHGLIYTRQVFMEILRMYTVVPFLPRALNQADQLGGYNLPAEATVLVFFHGVHHNPRVWDHPEIFDPERFTSERISEWQSAFAYVPFSAGPRKCAGNDFAMIEGTLAIALILQKFKINVLPNQSFAAKLGTTLRPGNGVKAILSERFLEN